jgi:hypothetical protein
MPKFNKTLPSQKVLKSEFTYDRSTGYFVRKIKRSHNSDINGYAGSVRKSGEVVLNISGKEYRAHDLAWVYEFGFSPKFTIMHLNGNKSDNRLVNLFERPTFTKESDVSENIEIVKRILRYEPDSGKFIFQAKMLAGDIGKEAGYVASHGYMVIPVFSLSIYAHRLAWIFEKGSAPKNHIDHINGDSLDNRIANLRDVERRINMENQRTVTKRNRTSKYLGVHFSKAMNKYVSQITTNGIKKTLGVFASQEEAYSAYLTAKRELHAGCSI